MGKFLVMFEVTLTPEGKDGYLKAVAKLKSLFSGFGWVRKRGMIPKYCNGR